MLSSSVLFTVVQEKIYTETGTCTVGITASGTETRAHADSGTCTVGITCSGTEARIIADSGTATVTISPTGTDSPTRLPLADSAVGGWFADVASGGDSGSITTLTLHYNQNVPVGTMLMVNVVGSGAAASSIADTAGNSFTQYTTVTIGGATQVHQAVFYCYTTVAINSGDTLTFTYVGSTNGRAATVSAYNGTLATSILDTVAGNQGAISGSAAAISVTASHVTAQNYEQFYVAYAYATDVVNPVFDTTYGKRTQATSTGTIRTVASMDNSAYTTSTPTVTLNWTGNGHCTVVFIPIKMAGLPSRVNFTPSMAEVTTFSDSATCNLTTIPSVADVGVIHEAGTSIVSLSAAASSEVKNLRPPDTGTVNLTTDPTNSTEVFYHSDLGTSLLRTSQPFRQDIASYTDTTPAVITFTPGNVAPQYVDSCLHCTLTPRYAILPVGGRYQATASVHYNWSARKRWKSIDIGECPN